MNIMLNCSSSKTDLAWESNSPSAHEVACRPVTEDASSTDSTSGIEYPGENDVMFGRGGESNKHPGNIKFRKFIEKYKKVYQTATRSEKAEIALEVVYTWREMNPPGHFLAKSKVGGRCLWHDVGDEQARKKASKSLGERKTYDTFAEQTTSTKRSRDYYELEPETPKRLRPDCTTSTSVYQNDATILCSHLMPDDWSDSKSSGNDSLGVEDACSDGLCVSRKEPAFLSTEKCDLWHGVDDNTEQDGSQVWVQQILRDTSVTILRTEESNHGLPLLSMGANEALKSAMNNIPTAAELAFDSIFL